MFPKSMKTRLVAGVTVLVIASGLTISLWVTHRYGDSLVKSGIAQAESLAHAVALESAERVLTNDRVALQKMLNHQMRSNPNIAYMLVVRDGHVLADTFPAGVPKALIDLTEPLTAHIWGSLMPRVPPGSSSGTSWGKKFFLSKVGHPVP